MGIRIQCYEGGTDDWIVVEQPGVAKGLQVIDCGTTIIIIINLAPAWYGGFS